MILHKIVIHEDKTLNAEATIRFFQKLVYKMENAKKNDENDITIGTITEEKGLPYFELTGSILNCCFEVINERRDYRVMKKILKHRKL